MLFEDTWNMHGSQYMQQSSTEEPVVTTIPDELPIAAAPETNVQLTDSAPPVDDEEYIPMNNKELSSALSALALKVPDDFVESIYRQVRSAALNAEMQGANLPGGSDVDTLGGTADEGDEPIEERFNKLIGKMIKEAYWGDIKLGKHYEALYGDEEPTEEELEAIAKELDSSDPELDDDGNYVGPGIGDTIQGKYLAQYYRDKPGADKSKQKGSGESTMVTGSGRLLQNVVRPLLDVNKEELADATEYLRLQFKMLANKMGMEKFPNEAPRTFQGIYLKKLVPKMSEEQLGDFLRSVITDYKRRSDRWLLDLAQKALDEVESERSAYASVKATLEKEAPEQAAIW